MEVSIGRRRFMFGAAGLVAGSFLRFAERTAVASPLDPGFARRLIIFFSPNGTMHQHWRPSGSGTNFAFPAGSVLEPLSSIKDELTVLDGVDFFGVANHEPGMSAMLTGGGTVGDVGGGASVDQYVAAQLGAGMKFPSLDLSAQTSAWGANNQTRMLYSSPGNFVAPDDNPKNVFKRMFGDAVGPAADAQLVRRTKVLDTIRGELKNLQSALGNHQFHKLQAHLEALNTVEAGLAGPPDACAAPDKPTVSHQANDSFPDVLRAQTDLMLLGLSCGMTRVATLQATHTVSPLVMSWLGHTDGHHSLSHAGNQDTTGMAKYVAAERWFAEQFAYLVQRLSELPEPEGDGSMLDHSLVVWASEMGDGRLHDCVSVPFVLAGRAGGFLTPGRYLKVNPTPHQKLLVSICHAMGLDNATYGNPAHGGGPLMELLS